MSAPALDQFFTADASRIEGEVQKIQRVHGRVSAMMKKEVLPDGNGFNFLTTIVNRSTGTGGGWVAVSMPDGTGNNCVPTPTIVNPSMSLLTYTAAQTTLKSNPICFQDYRRAYRYQDQIKAIRENFVEQVVDTWEIQDKAKYFYHAGHKLVFDGSLTETTNGTTMPDVRATSIITQQLLNRLYTRMIQDGAGRNAYASKNGAPLITAVMSSEAHETLIQGNSGTRDDFRWAESGKGDAATLLKGWHVDMTYANYLHAIDDRMPRFDFVNGAYVERPFYSNSATTIGEEAIVNPAYESAEYEDIYIWNPDVVHREVPKPLGTVGADTRGTAVRFNGEVFWLNIPNEETNPTSDTGFWMARLYAAYKPLKPRYGYIIRIKRCPNVAVIDCPAY